MTNIESWIINTQTPEEIKDIADYGCINGTCAELIYYDDTAKFYDMYSDEIWDFLISSSESYGFENIFDFFFNKNFKGAFSDKTFKNTLVWFVVDEVCAQIVEEEKYAQFMS
tara:strand:- start:26 stop:361 length:336 start_codon:yes stop_codon:yes gene_type:complete